MWTLLSITRSLISLQKQNICMETTISKVWRQPVAGRYFRVFCLFVGLLLLFFRRFDNCKFCFFRGRCETKNIITHIKQFVALVTWSVLYKKGPERNQIHLRYVQLWYGAVWNSTEALLLMMISPLLFYETTTPTQIVVDMQTVSVYAQRDIAYCNQANWKWLDAVQLRKIHLHPCVSLSATLLDFFGFWTLDTTVR